MKYSHHQTKYVGK